MRQQPCGDEQAKPLLRVTNRDGPEEYAIFEEQQRGPDAIRYAKRSREQRHLDIVRDELRREGGFDLCRVHMSILSFHFLIDALARIAQVVGWEQNVYRSRVVEHRQSAQCRTQQCNEHCQPEVPVLPAKRFRKRCENPQPAAWLPNFGACRRSVVQLRISPRHEPLDVLPKFGRESAVRDAIQIRGRLGVKFLQLLGFGRLQAAVGTALQRGEQGFEFAPARTCLSSKSFQIQNHSRCSRLLSKYPSTAVRRNTSAGTKRSCTSKRRKWRANAPRRWFSFSPASAPYTPSSVSRSPSGENPGRA